MKRQKGGRKWLNPLKLKQEKKTNKEKVGLAAVDKKENKTLGGRSYASVVFGCLTLWCCYIIIMLYYIIHSKGLYLYKIEKLVRWKTFFAMLFIP